MEHPRIWITCWCGEGFDYNEDPDYWLLEMGILHGLFRGNAGPRQCLASSNGLWPNQSARLGRRAATNLETLGRIRKYYDSQNNGCWDPTCPVKTGRKDVLATAYMRPRKTLVTIASWAAQPTKCKLEIDWKSLHLDPAEATAFGRRR